MLSRFIGSIFRPVGELEHFKFSTFIDLSFYDTENLVSNIRGCGFIVKVLQGEFIENNPKS